MPSVTFSAVFFLLNLLFIIGLSLVNGLAKRVISHLNKLYKRAFEGRIDWLEFALNCEFKASSSDFIVTDVVVNVSLINLCNSIILNADYG
jgi:hypothetical protein